MPTLTPVQWALSALCAVFVGIAKTGVPGLAILVVPLMVLVAGDARQSAGWLLPILCTADVFALYYWRRHAEARRLFSLAPWVLVGMAMGAAALGLNERVLRVTVGAVVLLMLGVFLWQRLKKATTLPVHAAPYGITAGFATTVANAAGPVMNLYLLGKRLPKEEFLATGAWFFFMINLTKVPIYLAHGLISLKSLTFDAALVPAVLAGALTGRWVVEHLPHFVFELLVVAMTVVATLLLFR